MCRPTFTSGSISSSATSSRVHRPLRPSTFFTTSSTRAKSTSTTSTTRSRRRPPLASSTTLDKFPNRLYSSWSLFLLLEWIFFFHVHYCSLAWLHDGALRPGWLVRALEQMQDDPTVFPFWLCHPFIVFQIIFFMIILFSFFILMMDCGISWCFSKLNACFPFGQKKFVSFDISRLSENEVWSCFTDLRNVILFNFKIQWT